MPGSGPSLSERGIRQASKVTPFWTAFDRMLSDAYHRENNPTGFVNMGVANNYTMEHELLQFCHSNFALDDIDLTYGSSLFGSVRLFKALCQHYNRSFQPHLQLEPQHIITGPGAGPLIDQIFEHLADPEDGVLCAAPYYNGFDADLSTRAHVKCVPVYSSSCDGSSTSNFVGSSALRGFEAALSESQASGTRIRAVLLCNPNNPVGRAYDRDALLEYGRFCEAHDLHLVVDEIYALSVFPTKEVPNPQPFISAISIDWASYGVHPARVHIVASASKDFGINGFRVGWLICKFDHSEADRGGVTDNAYSYKQRSTMTMKLTSKLYMIGAPSDALFSALLSDTSFLQSFVKTNRTRLATSYELARSFCIFHRVPYTPSNACHFFLVDLSRWTDQLVRETETSTGRKLTPKEAETALWAKALSHKLVITPGSNYHHPQCGIFRLTFSQSREAALEGFARLERTLGLPAWTPPTAAEQYDPTKDEMAVKSLDFVIDSDAPSVDFLSKKTSQRPHGDDDPRHDLSPAKSSRAFHPCQALAAVLDGCSMTSGTDSSKIVDTDRLEELSKMASACQACSC